MNFFLLFDAECPSCTKVAKQLDRLGIRNLGVRSLRDPELTERLASAGKPLPDGPVLVRIEPGSIKVWTGFGMRMRLARLLGIRRAAAIAGLVVAEAKARKDRHSATEVSRRRILGGTAAAGIGALVFGVAKPAAAAEPGAVAKPLDAHVRRQVLANPAVATARSTWGEVDEAAILAVTGEGETVAVLLHQGSRAFTVAGLEADAFALTIVPHPETRSLRYYLPSGTPIAEQTIQNSTVDTHALADSPHKTVEPEGVKEFAVCMVGCLGAADITADCLASCTTCAVTVAPYSCLLCGLCAGPKAYKCIKQCKPFL